MALQKNAFEIEGSNNNIAHQAINFAREDLVAEEAARGWLPPSRIVSPLANGGYSKEEYANMERDRGKYVMYAAAIRDAIRDLVLKKQKTSIENSAGTNERIILNTLVPGCGRGRLVQFILDAVDVVESEFNKNIQKEQIIDLKVWAVDVNPIAISNCEQRFSSHSNVYVVGPVALIPGMKSSALPRELSGRISEDQRRDDNNKDDEDECCHPLGRCDLIVSELLGSFADNEFMTAVSETIRDLFLNKTNENSIMIPDSFATYIAPISCPRATHFMTSISKPLDAPYNMSLTDEAIIWGEGLSKILWEGKCYESKHVFSGNVTLELSQPKSSSMLSTNRNSSTKSEPTAITSNGIFQDNGIVCIDGLVGYFTSKLYGNLSIDTRPKLFNVHMNNNSNEGEKEHNHSDIKGRNSMHWEAFYFPFPSPLKLKIDSQFHVKVSQLSYPPNYSGVTISKEERREIPSNKRYRPHELDEMWYSWEVYEGETFKRNFSSVKPQETDCLVKVDARKYAITLGSYHLTNLVPAPSCQDGKNDDGLETSHRSVVVDEPKLKFAKLIGNAEKWKCSD